MIYFFLRNANDEVVVGIVIFPSSSTSEKVLFVSIDQSYIGFRTKKSLLYFPSYCWVEGL